MRIYRLPLGEELLAEKVVGEDESGRRVIIRVETCNGVPAVPRPRMLCFQSDNEQVIKECRYGVLPRAVEGRYFRVVIQHGVHIVHSTRGEWKYQTLDEWFKPENFDPFTSINDALAYGQSWVRSGIPLKIEVAEVAAV